MGVVTSAALSAVHIAVAKAALRLDVANAYHRAAGNTRVKTEHAVIEARTGLAATLAAADWATREVQARTWLIALATNRGTPDVTSAVPLSISRGSGAVADEREPSCGQTENGLGSHASRLRSILAASRLPGSLIRISLNTPVPTFLFSSSFSEPGERMIVGEEQHSKV